MIISYLPVKGISVDSIYLEFKEKRESIRAKMFAAHTENNAVIPVGDIILNQRRDIYKNLNSSENFFFFNYDENDLLRDVEVHYCDEIRVLNVSFGFNDEVDAIAKKLERYSEDIKEDEGEYFFKDLQMVIVNQTQMGGEGSTLGYFYCSVDVSHLEK